MSALTIAGKEFDDAVRSRALRALGVVFVGALVAVTAGYALVAPRPTATTSLVYVVELVRWLVPVTALVVGYDAVVGERESGTLALLFGLPHTRGQVLVGKALGRFAAVVAPLTVGVLVSLALSTQLYDRSLHLEYAVLLVATTFLAGAFVSVAVASSALGRSTVRVVATVVGTFVGFLFLWDLVPATVHVLVVGGLPGAQVPPAWYVLLLRLNPVESFVTVLTGAFPSLAGSATTAGPFYVAPWFAWVLLLGWVVAPLALAFARFRAADLA